MDWAGVLIVSFARACASEPEPHPLSGSSASSETVRKMEILRALDDPECWPRSWAHRRAKARKERLMTGVVSVLQTGSDTQ